MTTFKLPDLGEGLPDAEIHEWHVKEGDDVTVDQAMVSMETAKAVVEVPAPRTGKIKKLHGKAGDIIKTGAPLVEFEGEAAEAKAEPAKPSESRIDSGTVAGTIEVGETVIQEAATGVAPTRGKAGGKRVLPAVRGLAKQLGVDLDSVVGTGPNGTITRQDITNAPKSGTAPAATAEAVPTKTKLTGDTEPLRGVRRTMARAMVQSHQEIVPVTLFDDADIHAWPEKTDITLRIMRAVCVACKAEPALNAWFDGNELSRQLHDAVHIGMAMDSKEGLFVPVIRNADTRDAKEIRGDIERYKTQVKDRSIPQEDLKDYTIMLSNFGTFAGRYANPIIVPPCVAILGTGRIRNEAVIVDGKPDAHRVISLSLSFDHRGVTGGEATRFLGTVIKDLQSKD